MPRETKTTSARHKFLTLCGILLSAALVPIIIVNIALIIISLVGGNSQIPSVGGYFPLAVKSGSMSGTIEVGDLIFDKKVTDASTLAVGDIITYWDKEPGTIVITHRITEVIADESGSLAFATKGDANAIADSGLVSAKNVLGIYQTRIAKLGDIVMFAQTPFGMLLCVGLPLILLVAYDLLRRRQFLKKQLYEKDKRLMELEQRLAKEGQNPL